MPDSPKPTPEQFARWQAILKEFAAETPEAFAARKSWNLFKYIKVISSQFRKASTIGYEMTETGYSWKQAHDYIVTGNFPNQILPIKQTHETEMTPGIDYALEPDTPLSDDYIGQIKNNLANPRKEWALPPIVAGDWTEQSGDDAFALLDLLGRYARTEASLVPLPIALNLDRVRTRPLACYGGAILVEAQGYNWAAGICSFILHEKGVTVLNGRALPLHILNEKLELNLSTENELSDYVLIFMNWVFGEDGRFQPLVKSVEFKQRLKNPKDEEAIAQFIYPKLSFELQEKDPDKIVSRLHIRNTFKGVVPIIYGDGVFNSDIVIYSDGMIEMTDDQTMLEDIALHSETVNDFLFQIDKS